MYKIKINIFFSFFLNLKSRAWTKLPFVPAYFLSDYVSDYVLQYVRGRANQSKFDKEFDECPDRCKRNTIPATMAIINQPPGYNHCHPSSN